MAIEASEKEIERAGRILKHGIFVNSLQHRDKFDQRTIAILKKNGLFEKIKLNESDEIIKKITKPENSLGPELPLGPLTVSIAPEKKERLVISLAESIFSPNVNVRSFVLSYFKKMRTPSDKLLTPKTISIVSAYEVTLMSEDSKLWRTAAIQIYDAIKEDWLCNLAGTKQSLFIRFEEGIEDYLTPVLRPAVSSLDSINPFIMIWNPSLQQKEITDNIIKLVADSEDLKQAIDLYYQKFGYLPLKEDFSLCRLLSEWEKQKGTINNAWDLLWQWADEKESPLARYHVCQVMVNRPDFIPEGQEVKLWDEITEIVHLPRSEEKELNWTQVWRIRCELARHFISYLESRTPWQDGERIAVLSWWLAEQVSLLFGTLSDTVHTVREATIMPEMELSVRMRQIAHPPIVPSTLHYGTLYVGSIWALSLLSQLGQNLSKLSLEKLPLEKRELIRDAFNTGVLGLFPIKPKDLDKSTYAFEQTVIPSAEIWANLPSEKDQTENLRAFIAGVSKFKDEGFKTILENVMKSHTGDQALTTIAMRVMAYTGEIPVDVVWECLSDQEWRKTIFSNWEENSLDVMYDALVEIQTQYGDKWSTHLPHVFAIECTNAPKGSERQKFLFACTVLSSMSSNTVSAIQRLLKGPNREQLVDDVTFWRNQFEEMQKGSPPWVASRLRSILASLYIT